MRCDPPGFNVNGPGAARKRRRGRILSLCKQIQDQENNRNSDVTDDVASPGRLCCNTGRERNQGAQATSIEVAPANYKNTTSSSP
jgi:hypothetical protein